MSDSRKYQLTVPTKTCSECPLKNHPEVQKQVTTEYYGTDINVMFIAEAPGESENAQGRPSIGRTGRMLRRTVLQANNNSQLGVAYGNVVRCRPTKTSHDGYTGDRPPTPRELRGCRANIWRDIKQLQPKAIVICGDSAAKGLCSNLDGTPIDQKAKIGMLRGKDFLVKLPDGTTIPAVVTYHFSHAFRTPHVMSVFREDIAKVFRRVRGELSDCSQRGQKVTILDTVPRVKKFLTYLVHNLTKEDVVAVDYETEKLTRYDNPVLCVGFAFHPDRSYVIPLKHRETPFDGLEHKHVVRLLRKFFRTKNPSFRALVAHNLKFEELITMDQFGTHILMPVEDTQQRAHVLNEDRKGALSYPYSLKYLVEEQLGFYHYHDEDIAPIARMVSNGRSIETSLEGLAEYNGMDAYCTWRLYRWQNEWAAADGYLEQFSRLSLQLLGHVVQVLAEMERNGLLTDIEAVRALMADDSVVKARMVAIEQEMHSLDSVKKANALVVADAHGGGGMWGDARDVPWVFKLGKEASKLALFFDVLGLDPVKVSRKTKVPSVGKELYERYTGLREIDLYEEYTQLQQITSVYVKGVHKFLHTDPDMMRDSRVRSHFRPTGTVTGRLSSADPNMLNIPTRKKTEAAKAIKRLYIVPPGYVLVCADYSQAEVRWLAEITRDKFLIQAFQVAYQASLACRFDPTAANMLRSRLEGDFHKHTASMIYGVPITQVTEVMRQNAKAIVFGLVYGMSTQGLASRLHISENKAKEFIAEFFARFPTAKQELDKLEEVGFQQGHVLSPTGRRKLINSRLLIGSDDVSHYPKHLSYLKGNLNHELRVCRNAPIQGVASDTNLLACSQLLNHILTNELDWKIINTVYDSILLEVPYPDAVTCVETTQSIMEDPKLFSPFGFTPEVPFKADFSVGVNWGDQFAVAYDKEAWLVVCDECGKTRKEKQRPTNRRCEECGSTKVQRRITTGSLDLLLKRLDRDHGLEAHWG